LAWLLRITTSSPPMTGIECSIICSIFMVLRYNDLMQFPIQPLLQTTCHVVEWTLTGFWIIGYWICWPL
jgi:hypothetical protein